MKQIKGNLNDYFMEAKLYFDRTNKTIKTSNATLLFGNTGSGKTTLLSLLRGKNVKVEVERGCLFLAYEIDMFTLAKKTPDVIEDVNDDMTYVEIPELQHSIGYDHDIFRAFGIHYLLKTCKNVIKAKILLVIKADEINCAICRDVDCLFQNIDEMFPHLNDSEKKAIGVIITCASAHKKPSDYLSELSRNAEFSTRKWCEYFINHQEQTFVVTKPSKSMVGQLFDFEDRTRLLSFIKKDQLINPTPKKVFCNDGIDDKINKFISDLNA